MLRRVASSRANASNALFLITWFKGSIDFENIHPLESGFLRTQVPARPAAGPSRSSRSGGSIRNTGPRRCGSWRAGCALYLRLRRIYLRIKQDPQRFAYTDVAMTPLADSDVDTLELFGTKSAQAYVNQEERLRRVREAPAVPAA